MKLHKFVVNSNDSSVVCIIGVPAGLIVALREIIPPAFAGLALVYSSQLTGILQNVVRFASETESRFTSVQRIQTYLQVKFPFIKVKLIFSSFDYLHLFFQTLQSQGPSIIEEHRPPQNWPQEGSIKFSHVKMRYRSNLPLVLNNVSFEIKPKEKIGVFLFIILVIDLFLFKIFGIYFRHCRSNRIGQIIAGGSAIQTGGFDVGLYTNRWNKYNGDWPGRSALQIVHHTTRSGSFHRQHQVRTSYHN